MVNVILSVLIEYIIFAYCFNSVVGMKNTKIRMNFAVAGAYALYALWCVFSHVPMLNVVAFFVMNSVLLCALWRKHILFNILNSVVLTAFMMFSELLTGIVFDIGVGNVYTSISKAESFILFAFSKVVYFICVVILRRYIVPDTENKALKEEVMFLVLPVATCVFFNTFAKIRLQVDNKGHSALVMVSVLLILANVLIYLVYNMISDKNAKIRVLDAAEHKRELEYTSYELLKDRYDELRGMIHDFEKYCSNIEGLLASDTDKARAEIKAIREKNKALLLVEHTNNKALNVILDQKMRECKEKGIEFNINIQKVDLSYISELDTVTIFSNLIDNAIEGCRESQIKIVDIEIFVINDAYTVIRIVNACKTSPKVKDGWFATIKKDGDMHGIGLKNVQRALDVYGAKMKCSYEKDAEVFCATILINKTSK